jgi:uncharacterized protein (DUF433 family)
MSNVTMSKVIVRDPEILGGRAVFRGTRVPVEVLFENLEDGLSIGEIIESYPSLNKEDVIACLEQACANLKGTVKTLGVKAPWLGRRRADPHLQ